MVFAPDRDHLVESWLPWQPFLQALLRLSRRLYPFKTHNGAADESQADSPEPADKPTALEVASLALELTRHEISDVLMLHNASLMLHNSS
jgi:hypothetical protein